MSQKSHYFKLGVFVIIAVFLMLVGIFFLGAREMFRKEWTLETYFDHSVDGLSIGSPVKMMGVKIGSVKEISFVYEDYDTELNYVYVLFSIDPLALGAKRPHLVGDKLHQAVEEKVEKGIRLTLSSQGITGVSFLDAGFHDPAEMVSLPIDWKPKHPYIPSIPGTLARLGSSLEKTLENLSQMDFAAMGKETEETLVAVRDMINDELNPLIAELRKGAMPALDDLQKAAAKTPELADRLNLTLEGLSDWIREQKGSLAEVVEDLRLISENLRQLTESAQQDPSHVLWGKPPPPSEVIESQ